MPYSYKSINCSVMCDTEERCRTIPELAAAIKCSVQNQYMVAAEENVNVPVNNGVKTSYIVSGKRSFEAAKGYPGKKVAVLNYANNHSVGGAPFRAGAQEESLCRCSTLYPCLQAMYEPFYQKHQQDYKAGKLTNMGNDDLIYTPDVIVFKTDERTEPIKPEMMPEGDWYKVDVITCAAPELYGKPQTYPAGYRNLIAKRIKRILDVAAKEQNEVLILGAWGCGAFGNSLEVVASVFMELLPGYGFETVEFAMSKGDGTNTPFEAEIKNLEQESESEKEPCQNDLSLESDNEERFSSILMKTGRQGVHEVLDQLKNGGFFTAPGSVVHHSNWKGGLLDHSMKVYDIAMKLRAEFLADNPNCESDVPQDSVTIAALLHDVCKFDEYQIGLDGKPCHREPESPLGGHGFKSVILLLGWGLKLTSQEILAIRWHMGRAVIESQEELILYQKALNLAIVKIIVKADHDASHQINC